MPLKAQSSNARKVATPQPASQDTHQPAPRDAAHSVQRTGVGPGALSPGDMLALQRTVGNRAVGQMLGARTAAHRAAAQPTTGMPMLQRLPTRADVVAQLGEPDNTIEVGGLGIGGSSKYKPVLEALTQYHLYIVHNNAGSATLGKLMALYEKLQTALDTYIGKKGAKDDTNPQKLTYMQTLRDELVVERIQARKIADSIGSAGPKRTPPLWIDAFKDRHLAHWGLRPEMVHDALIKDKDITGGDRGGTNEVAKVRVGKETHYWKADKNEVPLTNLMTLYGSDHGIEKIGSLLPGTRYEGMAGQALSNEYVVPVRAGIIDELPLPELNTAVKNPKTGDAAQDKQIMQAERKRLQNAYTTDVDQLAQNTQFRQQHDLHYSKRDVAMYRIDQLLNAGIIVPARLALRKMGSEYVEGSLMAGAKGTQAGEMSWKSGGEVKSDDGALQRMLSRLQLLDALAYQVDRNFGNFFLETDGKGSVTNITGIDNDMSFGKGKMAQDIHAPSQEYPGISAYVDEELALKILALKPQELGDAVFGLLSKAEIVALMMRLTQLQTHLSALHAAGKLLKPGQWDIATARGLIQEKSSYYQKLTVLGLTLPPEPTPNRPRRKNALPSQAPMHGLSQPPQNVALPMQPTNVADLDGVPQIRS